MQDSYGDTGSYMIRVRVLRQELEREDLTDAEALGIQQCLDGLVGVPIELQHVDRLRALTDDQLLRLWRSHEPEKELEPLPNVIKWDSADWPDDRVVVMIEERATWRAGGKPRQVGRVWLHTADGSADGVVLEHPEEPRLGAIVRAFEIAVERGLGRVYSRRGQSGPS